MRTPDGFALGTVCVISAIPRPDGITEAERRWLDALAGLAVDELELRLQARRATEAAAGEARLRRAQEAAGVTAFEASAEAGPDTALLPALRRLFGLEPAAPLALLGQPATAEAAERPRLEAVATRLAAAGAASSRNSGRRWRMAGCSGFRRMGRRCPRGQPAGASPACCAT
ncbi:hypothetical protein [Dankookia sp. P2]|uniref:hypothetical protein n=1 Tax=Dankookia sp. P2 TaxID=3423955 RepID=UPI003D679E35